VEDYDESPIVIDGYSSVQAIRRAQKRAVHQASKTPDHAPDAQTEHAHKKKPGTRIDHTVIPQKHEVVCYECEYPFMMAGRIQDTMCPKCHKQLRMTDHIINGEWTEAVKTIGIIDFKAGGILKGAELRARDIILAGNAEDGSLKAGRKLELCKGARFNIAKVRMKDLVIRKGGDFAIKSAISCRNLEVEGALKARIFAEGIVTIKRGGVLDGELHTPHLSVEEGGGLKAAVVIGIGKDRTAKWNPEPELVVNNQ